ncbi:type I-E CRISPR-associated protein Cse2/CasB [uncultured Propionibacterium sp.]|uniref:type I-E CRISPR-associated protein Cse2/CasB n=1 Tax=uncultured Propionibacterium sp. TaxID=218066 RepID=UPI0029300611|nr:type I-E CRISPR-associated protein Cse2/CasB [uncultured Propionibacterium sp.]
MTVQDSTRSSAGGVTPPDAVRRRSRRLGPAGLAVNHRIGGSMGLQERILRDDSHARGVLAALRRGVSKSPGEIPEIWELTQVKVPDHADDEPTWEEIAVHTAMTLYAVHQQSKPIRMFKPGDGLGRSARALIGSPDNENPSARARFNALVTSATIAELQHHLRTFVSLLRAKEIPVDHAMLADDIVRFQRPGGAKTVQLRWARQYYSVPQDSAAAPDSKSTDTSTSTTNPSEN